VEELTFDRLRSGSPGELKLRFLAASQVTMSREMMKKYEQLQSIQESSDSTTGLRRSNGDEVDAAHGRQLPRCITRMGQKSQLNEREPPLGYGQQFADTRC
jgi:hypothetical protein